MLLPVADVLERDSRAGSSRPRGKADGGPTDTGGGLGGGRPKDPPIWWAPAGPWPCCGCCCGGELGGGMPRFMGGPGVIDDALWCRECVPGGSDPGSGGYCRPGGG